MPTLNHPYPQRPFRYPIYLFLVLLVLIGLLMINGYFEIQRTRNQLFSILNTEALLVIKSIEKNVGNLIGAFSSDRSPWSGSGSGESSEASIGIEDLLIERLINLALRLDQEAAQKGSIPQPLSNRSSGHEPKKIFFLNAHPGYAVQEELPRPFNKQHPFFEDVLKGKTRLAVFRGEGSWRQIYPLAVAVGRRFDKGAILIILTAEDYFYWGRRIIIQGFLDDFSGKGNISYLRVEDQEGNIIAEHGMSNPILSNPQSPRKERPTGTPGLTWLQGPSEDFLEVLQPFKPADKTLGRIRLGMSLKEINPILNQAVRTALLTGGILLGLGMIGILIIFRLQGRHFIKMQELEDQIRLKEELSAMGQLASGVAHEIKNPLNAISLVVQRLQQEFLPADPEDKKEYERFTGIVRNEISRVNRIIGDFLMVSKPLAVKLEDCSLVEIIHYVLEVLGEEIRQKKIKMIIDREDPIPTVRSDRFQLTQVFLNILNNALEAMDEEGEIRLKIKHVRRSEFGFHGGKKLDLKLKTKPSELNRDFLEISVEDTGKGIPPEGLKKIFAHYYTTKEKGVGLGLAISQKIIQAHGGTLEIDSVVDRGTIVTVRLPLSPSDS